MELLDLPIAELKRQLVTGKDFTVIMKYFFDHFVDEPKFMHASHPVEVPKSLAEAVSKIFARVRKTNVVLSTWQIGEVSLLNLIHGSVTTSDGMAVVLWATDIEVGLISIPDLETMNTLIARVTISKPTTERAN